MRITILLTLALICVFEANPSFAQGRTDKIKAVFLFKFTDYITWPEAKKLTLCAYDDAFTDLLKKIGTLHKIAHKVKHIKPGSSLESCDLVYMPNAKPLTMTEGKPVLTVSASRGFAKNGGMIEMRETSERFKLIINLKQLENSGLKASSRLLSLAKLIR